MPKLNYSIPDFVRDGFDEFSDRTGRSKADVIRQLVAESVAGIIGLPPEREFPGPESRSCLVLSEDLYQRFNAWCKRLHVDKGTALTLLLQRYLTQFEEEESHARAGQKCRA